MKKISLNILFLFFTICNLFSQNTTDVLEKNYEKKRLKIDEVNILGSYYTQDGNNSGVTGGIGTEKLTDFSTAIDIKMYKPTSKGNKHVFGVNIGVDYYTSASSDNIDPLLRTSPSYSDTRYYPTLSYNYENTVKNSTIGGNLSFSKEYD